LGLPTDDPANLFVGVVALGQRLVECLSIHNYTLVPTVLNVLATVAGGSESAVGVDTAVTLPTVTS
jgi:hypothetical protein